MEGHKHRTKKYTYRGKKYTLSELCLLTGLSEKGLKRRIEDLGSTDNALDPESFPQVTGPLYTACRVAATPAYWAERTGISLAQMKYRREVTANAAYILREYVNEMRTPVHTQPYHAHLITHARITPTSNLYTVFDIYATGDATEESVLNWAFERVFGAAYPPAEEWVHAVNSFVVSPPVDYYWSGYCEIKKLQDVYRVWRVQPYRPQ